MNTHSHDFVTVDMRGLKAALVARAQADRVSVSVLVRCAVARELGLGAPVESGSVPSTNNATVSQTAVKLSIRLSHAEAERFAAGARDAGVSRGAYLAGLVADVPIFTSGANRAEHLGALVRSGAEMSTLSRNIHHLIDLLNRGQMRAAHEYRDMLNTLEGDIRAHLKLASGTLADLRPRGGGAGADRPPTQ